LFLFAKGSLAFVLVQADETPKITKDQLVAARKGSIDSNLFVEFQSFDSAQYIAKVCTGVGESCAADEKGTIWEAASKADPTTFVAFDSGEDYQTAVDAEVYQSPAHVLYFAGGGDPLRIYLDIPEFTLSFVTAMGKLGRDAAIKLLEENQAAAIQRAEAQAVEWGDTGVAELTMSSYKKVLQPVRDVKGQQVLVMYYGSYIGCHEERKILKRAAKLLNTKQKETITLSQVNCDVHREPCVASGVVGYCSYNLFVRIHVHLHTHTCILFYSCSACVYVQPI
jgi:hypothetical protein